MDELELALEEIATAPDAEQIRIYDISTPEMPIKCWVERSRARNKQVRRTPIYREICERGKRVGLEQMSEEIVVEKYGTSFEAVLRVGGSRRRGE